MIYGVGLDASIASHPIMWDDMMEQSALWGLRLFLLMIAVVVAIPNAETLFFRKHGWSHRLAGGLHLAWIVFGAILVGILPPSLHRAFWFGYDFILGCLGIVATLTAARDFPHRHVRNAKGQSGTLAERAIVTQSEMLEHAFYQGLNLWQALYLHAISHWDWSRSMRLVALLIVTSPWWIRQRFPVHSFSSNWKEVPLERRDNKETRLYIIKKMQYLFYKHAILHGINISLSISPNRSGIPHNLPWRVFWLTLNTSYVMEFFMQSMVKRRMLTQAQMLQLQRLLMTASTLAAAVAVFGNLHLWVFFLSLLLNLVHRGHEVLHTMLLAIVAMMISQE